MTNSSGKADQRLKTKIEILILATQAGATSAEHGTQTRAGRRESSELACFDLHRVEEGNLKVRLQHQGAQEKSQATNSNLKRLHTGRSKGPVFAISQPTLMRPQLH